MKLLIVANYNKGRFAPFVSEQAEALRKAGCEVVMFGMVGHGVWGYLKNLRPLRNTLRKENPDVIHAHYGLCGLLAGLQRQVPVVTTYHGSDINHPQMRQISRWAMRLSKWNLFVSQALIDRAHPQGHYSLLPCGVNLEEFPLTDKEEARQRLGLAVEKHYVLFASAFDNPVKNAVLAQSAFQALEGVDQESPPYRTELLELSGRSREEVALLLRAVDCLLMTSHSEGSPQVIKEALACECPIVSVAVGDVAWVTHGVEGCYLTEATPKAVAEGIKKSLAFNGRTTGRQRLASLGLTNDAIAHRLRETYKNLANTRNTSQY